MKQSSSAIMSTKTKAEQQLDTIELFVLFYSFSFLFIANLYNTVSYKRYS